MKDKKVLGFFSSAFDALEAGETFISDRIYSIQQVTEAPVDLGFYSHAWNRRTVQP
jgi:hypothetical protein